MLFWLGEYFLDILGILQYFFKGCGIFEVFIRCSLCFCLSVCASCAHVWFSNVVGYYLDVCGMTLDIFHKCLRLSLDVFNIFAIFGEQDNWPLNCEFVYVS